MRVDDGLPLGMRPDKSGLCLAQLFRNVTDKRHEDGGAIDETETVSVYQHGCIYLFLERHSDTARKKN